MRGLDGPAGMCTGKVQLDTIRRLQSVDGIFGGSRKTV